MIHMDIKDWDTCSKELRILRIEYQKTIAERKVVRVLKEPRRAMLKKLSNGGDLWNPEDSGDNDKWSWERKVRAEHHHSAVSGKG